MVGENRNFGTYIIHIRGGSNIIGRNNNILGGGNDKSSDQDVNWWEKIAIWRNTNIFCGGSNIIGGSNDK